LKKKILSGLLLLLCVVSAILLIFLEVPDNKRLSSAEELDELIFSGLEEFNIIRDQVRSRQIEIDSTFTRKSYSVILHPSFSKTQIHHRLHTRLHEYEIETPARVNRPDDEMTIFVTANGTVYRTIRLITDYNLLNEETDQEKADGK
jgi:hypothetical protein